MLPEFSGMESHPTEHNSEDTPGLPQSRDGVLAPAGSRSSSRPLEVLLSLPQAQPPAPCIRVLFQWLLKAFLEKCGEEAWATRPPVRAVLQNLPALRQTLIAKEGGLQREGAAGVGPGKLSQFQSSSHPSPHTLSLEGGGRAGSGGWRLQR